MSDRVRPRLTRVTSAAALVAAALLLTAAPPAAADGASVSFANEQGAATADPDFATAITVSGTGFQAIQGGFGGVYVLFGWVDPSSWRPSAGGLVGADYRYVPDQESRDNAGFQRFVAFAGSDTESSANAVMGADGSWSTTMNIPGAVFESQNRTGSVSAVDCRQVQCGIITIGAHGVKNANNETFTPVSFAGPAAPGAAGGTAEETEEAPAAATGAGAARVGYSGETAVAGNVLSFTAQGFAAGEQVVATLDDGVAAVGPLIAGAAGEVAGVLQLPSDLRAGTHLLTVSGAASGISAETEVTVSADPDAAPAAAASTAEPAWPYLLLGIAILVALIALIIGLVTSAVRRRRARKARKADAAVNAPADAAVADAAAADATGGDAPPAGAAAADAPPVAENLPRWSGPTGETGSDPSAETVKLETVR